MDGSRAVNRWSAFVLGSNDTDHEESCASLLICLPWYHAEIWQLIPESRNLVALALPSTTSYANTSTRSMSKP